MSFNYNENTWATRTSIEHAVDILTDINTTLSGLGYSSEDLLKASMTNAIWIMILAQGNVRADYDNLLYEVQNSLDPALCSDTQFLNILPIVGTEIILGNYTTVAVSITASVDGNVTIPASSEMPYTNDVYFITPDEEIVIISEETEIITVTANIRGPITVLPNQIITFSDPIENIGTITSAQSIEGLSDETIIEARRRVVLGKTFDNNLDGLKVDLLSLAGVTQAKCYFNPDSLVNLELPGGIEVLPRTLAVYVVGTSLLIGETIFKKLMLATQGSETQTYTTLSDQAFEVKFSYATSSEGYVTVYIPFGITLSAAVQLEIKTMVSLLTFDIGESMKASKVDQLFEDFQGADIVGSEVSLDDITYGMEAIVDANKYATIPIANVTITNMAEVV